MSVSHEIEYVGGRLSNPSLPFPDLDPEDFTDSRCRVAIRKIKDLEKDGAIPNYENLADALETAGELTQFGGLREVLKFDGPAGNLAFNAKMIKRESNKRKKLRLLEVLKDAVTNDEVEEIPVLLNKLRELNEESGIETKSLSDAVIGFEDLLSLQIIARKKYLPWLCSGALALIYGGRGIGKTMLGLGLASALVRGITFLKWPVSEPVSVLYIDGEMSLSEMRERASSLLPSPPKSKLHFLSSEIVYQQMEKDLRLTSEKMQSEMDRFLKEHPEIKVVILDNISCLFSGLREDRKEDWEPINTWLIRLRHRGLSVVLMHHGGKGGDQRGTSGREDALDIVIKLSHSTDYSAEEGCHFELRFTKSRSVLGDDVNPLDVKLRDLNGILTWTYSTIEESHFERVKVLIDDGMTSPSEIAEEIGISKGYASKLKKKVEAERAVS